MPKLYTVRALAEFFYRHPNTIYAWIEQGLFPHAFKIKEGWYTPENDVTALMESRCELPAGLERHPPIQRSGARKGFVGRWKN